MSRDRERQETRLRLLTALRSSPDRGLTEAALRRLTGTGLSLFQEVMPELLSERLVVISHSDGRRNQTEYHLIPENAELAPQEGPLSLLATVALEHLQSRPEGALGLAKRLEVGLDLIQQVLDELEVCGQVNRSQVGMLVIYRPALR